LQGVFLWRYFYLPLGGFSPSSVLFLTVVRVVVARGFAVPAGAVLPVVTVAGRLAVVLMLPAAGCFAAVVVADLVTVVVAGLVAAGVVVAAGFFTAGVVPGFTVVPGCGLVVAGLAVAGLAVAGFTGTATGCVVVLFMGGSTGPARESVTTGCPTGI
jgi:hypothetical protein